MSNGLSKLSLPETGAEGGVEKSINRSFAPLRSDWGTCEFDWGLRLGVRFRVSSKAGIGLSGDTGTVGFKIDFNGSCVVD